MHNSIGIQGAKETQPTERCDVYLAQLSMLRPEHKKLLDYQEQLRSAEYRCDLDRERFELGAVLLRVAISQTIGCSAAAVRLDRTCDLCGKPHGRPRVLGFDGYVSVSHSRDLVAVAITIAGPVGLDVETDESFKAFNYRDIEDRVIAESERTFVDTQSAFLKVWTRKEAILKATGYGLRIPMVEVVVSSPYQKPALISLGEVKSFPCFLCDIDTGLDYCASVAVFTELEVNVFIRNADSLLCADRGSSN